MTSDWLKLPVINIEFESTHLHPDVMALLVGSEKPPTGHAVQVDYQIPIKLSWWRRVWLRVRRKPLPMYPAKVLFPNATVTALDPTAD